MAFWVYILRCNNGAYYTGHTNNLERRLAEHRAGCFDSFTAHHRPVRLVFVDVFQTRDDAFRAEWRIKGWSRAKKEALIAGNWERLHQIVRAEWLAEGRNPPEDH